MNSSSNPNLSVEILRRIDQACDDFESAWRSGERPFVDDVLGDFPEAARGSLLNELLPIEIAWRLKSGETPSADSYLFRFPELDPARLEALLGADSTAGAEDIGTLAMSNSQLLDEFDSEVFDVGDSADSFNDLAVECAEFLRSLDGPGIVDARHVLRLLADSGQPLDQVSPAEVIALLDEKELLTRWQVDRLTKSSASAPESLVLGDYVLLDPLGKGGMGVVYRARHRRMDRLVALKTLTDRATGSDDSVQRFQREVRAAARLSHPNIVAAYDAGEHNGTHYLVMELVDGIDLGRLVRQSGPLNASRAVDYVRQAAVGFACAHAQGIIHRDIKPQNLLVDRKQHVRILDMGLARLNPINPAANPASPVGDQTELTQSGVIMGTVDFMSPEQATNTRNANERSDIYSLGCTLYFLLTGRAMFDGETCMERLLAHHQDSRPSLVTSVAKIPPELEAVFARMTARQPADRYASMDEVVEALEAVQSSFGLLCGNAPSASSITGEANGEAIRRNSPETLLEAKLPEPTFITGDVSAAAPGMDRFEETTVPTASKPAGTKQSKFVRAVVIAVGLCFAGWSLWPGTDDDASGSGTVGSGQPDDHSKQTMARQGMASLTLLTDRPQPMCDWPEASAAQRRQREVAEKYGISPFVENTMGMVLAVVPVDESGLAPFLVSTTEVTVREFRRFVEDTGYQLQSTARYGRSAGNHWAPGPDFSFENLGDLPVSEQFPACSICWFDAQAFCDWLSERENARYRLPTVAEWQTLNAGGSSTRWFFGDDDSRLSEFAWYVENAGQEFHEVAGKLPNALGIFDTLGNEYEWCLGAAGGGRLQLRPQIGGGFGDPAEEIARRVRDPDLVPPATGLHGAFRIVRELER
jgi:serine/threonine protein kinase